MIWLTDDLLLLLSGLDLWWRRRWCWRLRGSRELVRNLLSIFILFILVWFKAVLRFGLSWPRSLRIASVPPCWCELTSWRTSLSIVLSVVAACRRRDVTKTAGLVKFTLHVRHSIPSDFGSLNWVYDKINKQIN